jgi:hypothetical protein
MMHRRLVSWSLLRLDILVSLLFWSLGSGRSCGACHMLNTFLWTNTSYVPWFSTIQIEIVYMPTLFFLICEWFKTWLVDLHGAVIGCRHHMFWLQHGWCEWAQCWWRFPTFILSMFKKSIIIMHNLCNCLTQGHGIKHGQQWVFHVSVDSKLKLAHECNFVPWNVTC